MSAKELKLIPYGSQPAYCIITSEPTITSYRVYADSEDEAISLFEKGEGKVIEQESQGYDILKVAKLS